MKIAAQKVNTNGLILNKTKLRRLLEDNVVAFSRCNLYLYNNYVLDSPNIVDWIMLKTYVKENYPEEYKLLICPIDGSLEFTSKRLLFAQRDETDSIYNCIISLLEHREIIDDLNNIFEGAKFKKKTDEIVYKPNIIITSKIQDRGKISINNPKSLVSCIDGNFNVLVKDCRPILIETLCKRFNFEYSNNGKSLFFRDKDSTYDIEYFNELLGGRLKGDTVLSEKLFDDISKYYYENSMQETTVNSGCMIYKEHLFNECLEDMINIQKNFRLSNKDLEPLYVYEYGVLYRSDLSDSYSYNVDYKEVSKESFGIDCIDYFKKETLHIRNNLCGFNGEFIAENDLVAHELSAIGSTIELMTASGKIANYYPIMNVRDKNGNNLEPIVGTELDYCPIECNVLSAQSDIENIVNCYLDMQSNFESSNFIVPTRFDLRFSDILNSIENELKIRNLF